MTAYVLTPLANLTAAKRVMERLDAALRRLSHTPGIGHSRQDLCDGRERFFLVYSYLIVYRPASRPLQIVRGILKETPMQ